MAIEGSYMEILPVGRAEREMVVTTSWWRHWWLKNVQGYRVIRSRQRPRPGLFGKVYYEKTWELTRAESR